MKKLLCLLLCGLFLLTACSSPSPSGDSSEKKTADINPEVTGAPEEAVSPSGESAPESEESASVPEETGLLPGDEGFQYEGPGFDTPEDAVLYYLAGLKNLSIDQMLRAFAWETQAEHYSFRDVLTYYKGIDPTIVPGMPFSSDLLISANIEWMRRQQAQAIYNALDVYMLGEQHYFYSSPTGAQRVQDESEADGFLALFDENKARQLAEMTNIRFYSPDDVTGGKFSLPGNQKSFSMEISRYGADELVNIVAAADIGNEILAAAPTVARYGNKWYLVSVSSRVSAILGIDVFHQAFSVLTDDLKAALQTLSPTGTGNLPGEAYTAIRYERGGFDTPEEAVACYLEGLKNRNIQQMLSAFAWETQAARYSMRNEILRSYGVYRSMPVRIPSFSGIMDNASLLSLRAQQSGYIYSAVRSYVLQETEYKDNYNGMRVDFNSGDEIDAFIGMHDNPRIQKLSELTNIQTVMPETVISSYNSESTRNLLEQYRLEYGADELTEIVGAAQLGDETLLCDLILSRYGGKWYIVSVNGIAGRILGLTTDQMPFSTLKGTLEDAVRMLSR